MCVRRGATTVNSILCAHPLMESSFWVSDLFWENFFYLFILVFFFPYKILFSFSEISVNLILDLLNLLGIWSLRSPYFLLFSTSLSCCSSGRLSQLYLLTFELFSFAILFLNSKSSFFLIQFSLST